MRAPRRELALVLALPLFVHALSVRFELHEWYSMWFARLERWQVDELPKGPTGKILRREVHAPE